MSLFEMQRINLQFFKDSGTAPPNQVPASGASYTVFRQGATVSSTAVIGSSTNRVSVYNTGRINASDVVQWSQDLSQIFTVAGVDPAGKWLDLYAPPGISHNLAAGDRLVPLYFPPPLYSDSVGTASLPSNTVTLDAAGRASFYAQETLYDAVLSGAGPTRLILDNRGGWARGASARVNARDYPTIQAAIDALPPKGGTVYIPAGDYVTPSDLVVRNPFTEILGEGDGTVIHGSILCPVGYCTFDNFWIMGSGKQYALRLSNSSGFGVSPTAGVPRCILKRMRLGGRYDGSNDGPTNGLELDGAILTTAERCIFAFCIGDGVRAHTSDPSGSWSTNVNYFNQCTANGNGGWGYYVLGGSIQGFFILGGNIESNHTGAVYGQTVAGGFGIKGVDFEHSTLIGVATLISLASNVNPFYIEDNNFVQAPAVGVGHPGVTSNVISIDGCNYGSIKRNRFGDYFNPGNTVPVITVNFNCANVTVEDNYGVNANLIEQRGYWL